MLENKLHLIDMQEVFDCFGGNINVVRKTIARVYECFPSQWQELLVVIETKDTKQIDVIAHRLAGTLLMVGANEFSSYLRNMSHLGRNGEVPSEEAVREAEAYYHLLIKEMKFVIDKLAEKQ